jgi:hypothetical protein
MKNIHIFPKNSFNQLGVDTYGKTPTQIKIAEFLIDKDIYITSDKKIKVGDWYYLPRTNSVYKCNEDPTELNSEGRLGVAKIILTTDVDLIKDGVQAIPDEFLEWFVKNPSCESVEIKIWFDTSHISLGIGKVYHNNPNTPLYKIIIPEEEPKQETLEEVMIKNGYHDKESDDLWREGVNFGIKWQQEQDKNKYSEED